MTKEIDRIRAKVQSRAEYWEQIKEYDEGHIAMVPGQWQEIANELAALSAPAADDNPVEVWRGDRKVTIYQTNVLRVWGANMETEMSDEPRSLESVQAALDWLYADPLPVYNIPQVD